MTSIKHVVISAAGIGSRLGLNKPKCLVEINGLTLIDRQLALVSGIEDVRIVVGFKRDEIINHVLNIRKDVTFVHNVDYRNTTNSYSVYLASHDLDDPFISLDGDLIIEPESFKSFLNACQPGESLIGITKSKTEEAVFVELDKDNEHIINFKRKPRTDYEWTGLANLDNIQVTKNEGYIYRVIEKHLPLKAKNIICQEIDTPKDLEDAKIFVQKIEDKYVTVKS